MVSNSTNKIPINRSQLSGQILARPQGACPRPIFFFTTPIPREPFIDLDEVELGHIVSIQML